MSVFHGIRSFSREIGNRPADKKNTQVFSASKSFIELALFSRLSQLTQLSYGAPSGGAPSGGAQQQKSAAKKIVVVLPSSKEIPAWSLFIRDNLQFFDAARASRLEVRASVFPVYTCWGTDRYANPVTMQQQRIASLAIAADLEAPGIILTTLPAMMQKTLFFDEFMSSSLSLVVDQEYDLDLLLEQLDDLGYHKVSKVEDEGCWAVRGGIIDIFPLNMDSPIRVEFFADTLTSIRVFSVDSQRSQKSLVRLTIVPAREALTPLKNRREDAQRLYVNLLDQNLSRSDRDGMMSTFNEGFLFSGFEMFLPLFRRAESTLCDYLPKGTEFFFPQSIDSCLQSLGEFYEKISFYYNRDRDAHRPTLSLDSHFLPEEQVTDAVMSNFSCLEFGNPYSSDNNHQIRLGTPATMAELPIPKTVGGSKSEEDIFSGWLVTIGQILKSGTGAVAILVRTEAVLQRIRSLFEHEGIKTDIRERLFLELTSGVFATESLAAQRDDIRVNIGLGHLDGPLWLEELELMVLSEDDLLGPKRASRKAAPSRLRKYLSSFKDLKQRDLVVHVTHGIGRYLGLSTLDVAGASSDFLILEYAAKSKVYLPVDKLNLLQRYSGASEGDGSQALDKLGGQSWAKRKTQVKKAIRDMADELLRIQAKRQMSRPHVFLEPGENYYKLEADFPYQETEDQLRVLEEVEADLISDQLMDRLVVGDVGFGKTEIAIRACYRAVLEGYQVLVLVPTTILCHQHFENFLQRLGGYGVEVRQINRFVKSREIKSTLLDLKSGKVDVLIGTHRLLSKDVVTKNLGLLIVDEEQRFGVSHKERIKEVRANADVLTLTATPIPRTLHMAMLGLRQISIIATPPSNRLSIKTQVLKFDALVAKEAIEDELARGGQVFFLHNRVENIEEMATFVRGLVPNVEVRTAHGQMSELQLEKAIFDFVEQRFSVMVCTTIIESGIDMPNVNTILINQAERFGLSQLYQIRGRVGRSSVQAFAYLFTSSESLSPRSQKRLEALVAHQDLGSGFHIASHDLEIRGAGNLLGAEQSGQVAAVGIEMYTNMLDSVIKNLKGEPTEERGDAEFKVSVSAIIPQTFVGSESERLTIYKDMFAADSREELAAIRSDLQDRYGRIPSDLHRLFMVAQIRRSLRSIGAESLGPNKSGRLEIKFRQLLQKQISNLSKIADRNPQSYVLRPDYSLILDAKAPLASARGTELVDQDQMLQRVQSLLEPLELGT